MKSEEARVGKRVRVMETHNRPNLRNREGIVVKRWGDPAYAAIDVLLDEGGWELFWFHEVEEVDEDDGDARPPHG